MARAVQSALDQDYPRIEVVIVDDASSDDTVRLIRDRFGDRVRLYRNRARLGQARTTNAAIGLARGELIKFLHHDDFLGRECVSQMVDALARYPTAGMVFCSRHLEIPEPNEATDAWVNRYGDIHRRFDPLSDLNPSPMLFEQLLENDLDENWIGEPVCVMTKKECFNRVGCFSVQVRGSVDLGLWLRISAFYDIAFIDRKLVTYRHSSSSHIGLQRAIGDHWLDRLWMLETLNQFSDLVGRYPYLQEFLRTERHIAYRTILKALLGQDQLPGGRSTWWQYAMYRMRAVLGTPSLVSCLDGADNATVSVGHS